MSHITVRYFLAAAAVTASIVVGGSAFVSQTGQSSSDTTQRVRVVSDMSRVAPAPLHGELANSNRTLKCTTLGVGENLGTNFATLVKQIDPKLSEGEVAVIVNDLLQDLGVEAPGADVHKLSPGVSACVVMKYDARGVAIWDTHLSKYSGIQQEIP